VKYAASSMGAVSLGTAQFVDKNKIELHVIQFTGKLVLSSNQRRRKRKAILTLHLLQVFFEEFSNYRLRHIYFPILNCNDKAMGKN
jgi:hypothetical protein